MNGVQIDELNLQIRVQFIRFVYVDEIQDRLKQTNEGITPFFGLKILVIF